MEGRIKDFFRRTRRSKGASSSPRAKFSPPYVKRRSEQSSLRFELGSESRAFNSNHGHDNYPQQGRSMPAAAYSKHPQHPSNQFRNGPIMTGQSTSKELPDSKNTSQDATQSVDGSIAENYIAYIPVLSPSAHSDNAQHTTIGGDRPVTINASNLQHTEDIADRNTERVGSGHNCSRHTPINTGDKVGKRTSTGAELAGRSSTVKRPLSKATSHTSILDPPEHVNPEPYVQDRSRRPARTPPDEPRIAWRGHFNSPNSTDDNTLHESNYETRSIAKEFKHQGVENMDGGDEARLQLDTQMSLDKIVDLRNTWDVDQTTRWAPAVTHQTVKPREHEIREEQIYREIHNYDVYHRVQPIYETEILPARHFVPEPDENGLIEVPADQFPNSIGAHQRWFIGEKEPKNTSYSMNYTQITSPKVVDEKIYQTPEGFERKETTWLHPPTLKDMSSYGGPVRSIHFGEHGQVEDRRVANEHLNQNPEAPSFNMKALMKALPKVDEDIPLEALPTRKSSLQQQEIKSSDKGRI